MRRCATLFCSLIVAAGLLTGCSKRERAVDVQTPIGDVKVDKITQPNGEKGVDVNVNVGRDKPVAPVVP